jgi:hypothetical protein
LQPENRKPVAVFWFTLKGTTAMTDDKDHLGRQHAAAGKETNKEPHKETGLHSPADRGARPMGGVGAVMTPTPAAGEIPQPFSPEQLATPAPTLAGTRQMYIILGPYRGSVLTMPDAEAEDAKDSHWAVEMDTVAPPFDADKPPDHDHELTEEDRAYAVEAANAWAAKVNEPPEAPPPEGETEAQREVREKRNADRRALRPGGGGGYETRQQPKPEPSKR